MVVVIPALPRMRARPFAVRKNRKDVNRNERKTMIDLTPEIIASHQRDLLMVQTAMAQLVQISASVYELEGAGVYGANMKASAISVIDGTRLSIRRRLQRHVDALEAAITPEPDDVIEDDSNYPEEVPAEGLSGAEVEAAPAE